MQNDAPTYDTVQLLGTRGTARFRVRYLLAGADVTRKFVNGTFTVTDLPGGGLAPAVRIEVTVTRHAPRGSTRTVEVLATPLGADGPRDIVSITVSRRR